MSRMSGRRYFIKKVYTKISDPFMKYLASCINQLLKLKFYLSEIDFSAHSINSSELKIRFDTE